MSDCNVVQFTPLAGVTARKNVETLIRLAREQLTVFGAGLDYASDKWDTGIIPKGRRNSKRITFCTLETVSETQGSEWTPLPGPFNEFAKALVRYLQGMSPLAAPEVRLTALRFLEAALREQNSSSPWEATAATFNRAAQLARERGSPARAYIIGLKLEELASFMAKNRLVSGPLAWANPIPDPGKTMNKVGEEFDRNRKEKLPTEAALDALPRIFRLATDQPDLIISSLVAILMMTPDRVGELLHLPALCIHRGLKGELGLRWLPEKGGAPMIKWVIPSLGDIAEQAVDRLLIATAEGRRIAKWYEDNPDRLYLPPYLEELRGKELLDSEDIRRILGMSDRRPALLWAKNKGLRIEKPSYHESLVRFSDVEREVLTGLPPGFPVLDRRTGMRFSQALCVVNVGTFSSNEAPNPCMFEAIADHHIHQALGGAGERRSNIFAKHGFTEPDGSPIRVRSHAFRHHLNTLAQRGGLSQTDIAKWSGRKSERQNAAYDHVSSEETMEMARERLGIVGKVPGAIAKIPKGVLITRTQLAKLGIKAGHTTDFGYCIHDFAMMPCQRFRDCLSCDELICVKGDEERTANLRQRLVEAEEMLKHAEQAVRDGVSGADEWKVAHEETVSRLRDLIAIHDDPSVPIGSLIRLSGAPRPTLLAQAISDRSAQLPAPAPALAVRSLVGSVKRKSNGQG
ncbi:hypothetical protein [Azospirillum argentinense]